MAKLQRKRHSSVSTGGAAGFPGQYLLADGAKADIRTPDYNKKTLPTVAQIVPAITAFDSRERPVKPHFEPFRTMDGTKYENSHWYLLVDIVRAGIGDDRVTFILCDPHSGEDPRNTPYGLLYRRITRAVKEAAGKNQRVLAGNKRVNPNNWAGLLPGNNNTSLTNLAFSRPERSRVGFVPALMIVDNGKLVLHPETGRPMGGTEGNHAQILQISGNAMETLLKQAALPTDAFDEDSDDWDTIYQHGDVTRLDGGGKFCVIYNATHHTSAPDILCRTRPGTVTADAEDDYDPAEDTAGHGRRGGGNFASYSVDFTDRVRLPKISGDGNARYSNAKLIGKPDIADAVLSNYSEIWDYFQIPETEKHCRYLAEAFRSQPEIILFGWADNPEYFTDEVKGILAARTQVAAPGASQDEYDDDEDGVVVGDLYDDDDEAGVAGDQDDLYDDEPAPSKPSNRAAKAMARGAAAIEEDVNTYYDDEDDDEVAEVDEEIYEDDYNQEEEDADAVAAGVYEDAEDEDYEEEEEEEPVAVPPRRRRRDPVPLEKPAAKRATAKRATAKRATAKADPTKKATAKADPTKKAPGIADLAKRAAAKRTAASGAKPRVKRRPKDGLPPA